MYLILSSENDFSTCDVIDWFLYYNIPFIRINENDKIILEKLLINKYEIKFKLKIINHLTSEIIKIKSEEIKGYWYRRGDFNLEYFNIKTDKDDDLIKKLNEYKQKENRNLICFFNYYLKNINCINSYNDNFTNKLIDLAIASKLKHLKIPQTIITNNKKDLLDFRNKVGTIITKAITYGKQTFFEEISIGHPTTKIKYNYLNKLPDFFDYSKIQQFIDKKYDIRIFYLNETIQASAILSPNNKNSKVDFRKDQYNLRIVPFTIPEQIQEELIILMNGIGLNCGSIDIVVDKYNNFYFLEVNPIGQFGFISYKCNYQLEKKIFLELTKNETSIRKNNQGKQKQTSCLC